MKRHNLPHILKIAGLIVLITTSCSQTDKEQNASEYEFPNPVDTNTKPINNPERKVFDLGGGVYATNDFPSARLNNLTRINDTLLMAHIQPENSPVNNSAWYAFKIWSEEPGRIHIKMKYDSGEHRYQPKVSFDGDSWGSVPDEDSSIGAEDSLFIWSLATGPDTTWVAAQEIYDSQRVKKWCEDLANNETVEFSTIGKSKLGRDMFFVDIKKGDQKDKDLIVIFSRQHPPEVTGFFAMQAFVEQIVNSDNSDSFLDRFRVIVYPLLNPDGVDLGHWRHNAGGIDLNRDWAYYRQPETRQVADHVVNTASTTDGKVIFGLDFHSTYNDVYYTQDKETQVTPTTAWFRDAWFSALETQIPGYKVNEVAGGLRSPVTKGWFYTQFGAEAMTYEIGDGTPRDSIQVIGKISAEEMMKLFIERIE